MTRPGVILLILSIVSGMAPGRGLGAEADTRDLEFFERKIRPVLIEHCYRCHSAEAEASGKLRGGLLLDSREGLRQGGDSGPSIVPGAIDESILIEAIRYEYPEMPPEGPLPDSVVADIEEWVRGGAFDPRTAEADAEPDRVGGIDLDEGRDHWAYRPLQVEGPPAVADESWPAGAIDRFILARLESEGLRPVAEADRTTLIRRLTFDLIGLPPTVAEIDAFLDDEAPDAYDRLVDRLLASPHYGERWGRHWLDVARFAESVTLRGLLIDEAWRYRDYVIESFDADLPFDQFVREQIAGDLLPSRDLEDHQRQFVAPTFLSLGNINLEDQDKRQLEMDVVDEQLDTIGKALLAQTIGCARCHDHKFDPIPTADYYAMAGILDNVETLEHANVSTWLKRPIPQSPAVEASIAANEAAIAAIDAQIEAARKRTGGGVIAAEELPGIVVDDSEASVVGDWQHSRHSGTYIGDGYLHDRAAGDGEAVIEFGADGLDAGTYEVLIAYSPGPSRASAVPVTIVGGDAEATAQIDMRTGPTIAGRFVSLGQHTFDSRRSAAVRISNTGTVGHVTADAVVFLPEVEDGPAWSLGDGPDLDALIAQRDRLEANGPDRSMAMGIAEAEEIVDLPIHIRGSVHNLGEPTPRGVLRVATVGPMPAMPEDESGRRQLADWLADPKNPLTARVFVNRVWHWLQGPGIVRTTDNFGTTGETPSYPELLDYLADRFIDGGWSTKALVREIVRSRSYRLDCLDDPEARAADPENRLHWRGNRRRLDAECIRDAMLAVSGCLRRDRGGPDFPGELKSDLGYEHRSLRRSVYLPVFRNALPEAFEVFDFADPSMVVGRRDVSTVAPQALYLMNNPFVVDQTRVAAHRLLIEGNSISDGERLDLAYRWTLGRPPEPAERRIALEALDAIAGEGVDSADRDAAWSLIFQALFATIEFRYLD